MIRTLPRLLAVLAVVLVTVPIVPAAATAEPAKPTLTWSVQPADQRGPDGRRWAEHTLDPGRAVTDRLAVRNFSDRAAVFSLKAADGYLTDKGRFNMLPSDQKSVDGGSWIEVQEKVTVGANETKVVPFTVTVPGDATPGDHPAGIAATVTSTGGTVAVESRVGFRVLLRVSGTVTAALVVDDLSATYRQSWNPFAAGSLRIRYRTTNDGNVAVTGTGRATTGELLGLADHEARTGIEEMLPGGGREVDTRVGGVWGLGPLRTTVEVSPSVRGGGPAAGATRPASATVTVWALPWAQLALAAVLGALVTAFRVHIVRRRRRLAALLARARDEGRAEAREARGVVG
ncbi:hypothetical protein DMB66_09915 [Actinoplanes sp. ATCC 53533]|uniref:WxL protein peptidoglycan domain-containing protein n=1 Tax=Actinoplanes sp. ATCC 53533 TaxID=1288362 RepID=UPI000F7AADC8|nr:DUF916 domain-containing protein [Actinoplanes sp. ATCC 53533]RSM70094.1 hypothetical protein DMB66_09915 [Actinoplanes sp. ATCC 53533]